MMKEQNIPQDSLIAGYLPADYDHMEFTINSASLGIDHSAEVIRDIVLKKFGDMM